MISINQAAKYLIYLSNKKNPSYLTPLKLQKLLYLAQGWSFVWDNKPLFNAVFEAWQYGPVNAEVYLKYKKYGRKDIPANEGNASIGDNDAKETLDAVWRDYSGYSAFELVNLTHSQKPWQDAIRLNKDIKMEDIKSYFQSTY